MDLNAEIFYLKEENKKLQNNFEKIVELNKHFIEENKNLKSEHEKELSKKNIEIEILNCEVLKLKKELEKYKVKPNEPSSQKSDVEKAKDKKDKDKDKKDKNTNKEKNKKTGQKEGHEGKSRKNPEIIDKVVFYNPNCCECCGSENLKKYKLRKKIITDLIFEILNIEERYQDVVCLDCGHKTQPQSVHGNSKSPYGKGIQSFFNYLRTVGGMTLRPIENLFKDFLGLPITDTSISNNEIRISKESYDIYENYLNLIQNASYSHKDETSWGVNGNLCWMWVYDSVDHVFYRFSDNRGKKTVEKDFKDYTDKNSINDCYAAYNIFKNQQICWAHLLRESKAHAKKDNATKEEKQFHKELKAIFKRAQDFIGKTPPPEKRQQERVKLEDLLVKMMFSLKNKTEFLDRMCNRLSSRLPDVFLFVEVPGLPCTNNQAERSLRPLVIHRKTSFGSKSNNGAEARAVLKTVYENAKREGKKLIDAFSFLYGKKQKSVTITET